MASMPGASMVSGARDAFSRAHTAATAMASGLGNERTGATVSAFKTLLVGSLLIILLFLFLGNVMPDLHDDINSTAFRDIPGGELVADNITLFVLLIVMIASVVLLIDRVM